MEQLIERCAGLDVHKQTVSACVRGPGSGRGREQHVRRFGTTVGESDAEWPTSMPGLSFDLHAWTRQWLRVRNASLQRYASSLSQGTFVSTPFSSHALQTSEPELVVWAINRVLSRLQSD